MAKIELSTSCKPVQKESCPNQRNQHYFVINPISSVYIESHHFIYVCNLPETSRSVLRDQRKDN